MSMNVTTRSLSLPFLKRQPTKQDLYEQKEIKQVQQTFMKRFSIASSQAEDKTQRSLIHFVSKQLGTNGFQAFSSINAQNKSDIIGTLKDLKNRSSSLGLAIKAQITFNNNQYSKIQNFCKNQQEKQRKIIQAKLKMMEPTIIKQKVKTTQKYKNKNREIYGAQMRVKRQIYQTNKSCWKPFIDYDAVPVCVYWKVLFFGGRKIPCIAEYNYLDNQWKQKQTPSGMKCFGDTMGTLIKNNSEILFFGGQLYTQLGFSLTTNLVQIYNVSENQMKIIEFSEDTIGSRSNHAQCLYGQYLIVSGGINAKDQLLNTFMTYHIQNNYWTKLPISKMPSQLQKGFARHKMVPVFYQRKYYNFFNNSEVNTKDLSDHEQIKSEGIYLFGGEDSEANLSNKLYIIKIGHPSIVIQQAKTSGEPPNECKNFAMCKIKNFLLIHGGRNDQMNPFALQSVYCLDFANLTWIKTSMQKPFRRYNHVMGEISQDQVLIMGGITTTGLCKDVNVYSFEQLIGYV